jgi:hypothetical protein
LRAWSTTSRLPRIAVHGRVVGPSAASPIASARSYCSPAPSRHDRRSGWMLPKRWPDTHSDTRPDSRPRWTPCLAGWTARADTKADGHRDRPHGRTRSSGRLQLSILAGWPGSTNDERLSPHWTAVRPGVRVGVQLSRAGASIPTAMVRVMVKCLARQSPSRPCERPAWPHDVIRRFLGGASGRDGNGCGR